MDSCGCRKAHTNAEFKPTVQQEDAASIKHKDPTSYFNTTTKKNQKNTTRINRSGRIKDVKTIELISSLAPNNHIKKKKIVGTKQSSTGATDIINWKLRNGKDHQQEQPISSIGS